MAAFLGKQRARLEGLEPPTRCLEGSWATVLTDGRWMGNAFIAWTCAQKCAHGWPGGGLDPRIIGARCPPARPAAWGSYELDIPVLPHEL